MGYAGDFNGISFGNGSTSGVSVTQLSGWRGRTGATQVTEGSYFNASGATRYPPLQITLTLTLIRPSAEALEALIDTVVRRFSPDAGVLPMTIASRIRWVQVQSCVPVLQPDWPGPERTTTCTVQLLATDSVLYWPEPGGETWASPVTSDSFEVANEGWEVPFASRAWDLRLVASGTLVKPKVRVDHPDGAFEQVTFDTTLSSGQVLTLAADGVPRVGSAIRSKCISTNQTGLSTPCRIPWRLLDSTGSDGRNEVTVSAQSGSFTGHLLARGTGA